MFRALCDLNWGKRQSSPRERVRVSSAQSVRGYHWGYLGFAQVDLQGKIAALLAEFHSGRGRHSHLTGEESIRDPPRSRRQHYPDRDNRRGGRFADGSAT